MSAACIPDLDLSSAASWVRTAMVAADSRLGTTPVAGGGGGGGGGGGVSGVTGTSASTNVGIFGVSTGTTTTGFSRRRGGGSIRTTIGGG